MENENHCDFVKLREMLIRTNMEDMRETTHNSHYELFRRNKLQEMGFSENESKRFDMLNPSFCLLSLLLDSTWIIKPRKPVVHSE